ncbi:MAG: hypothetical protein KDA21_09170, partial [Phycisphaerales bacterium]|nr:hypothetical protein [Phycisphaerales bacterium]
VASAAHLLIEDCVVSGNAASSSGGGLACRGATAALENVIFSANTAGSGADVFVQNEGDFTATGCDFTSGLPATGLFMSGSTWHIIGGDFPATSGGLRTLDSTGVMEMSTFTDTTIGAVIVSGGETTLRFCDFTGCQSTRGAGVEGAGTVTIEDCTFTDCDAALTGGAIDMGGAFDLLRTTIEGGSADQGGQIRVRSDATLTMTDCELTGGSADEGGGIFLLTNSAMEATGTDFASHSSGANGIAISSDFPVTATLTDCDFSGAGMQLYIEGTSTLTEVRMGTGPSRGHVTSVGATTTATDCQFGGVFFSGEGLVQGCDFVGPSVLSAALTDNLVLRECTFTGVSGESGISFQGEMIDSLITGYDSALTVLSSATVRGCHFLNNGIGASGYARTIALAGSGTLLAEDCLFEGNRSNGNGGAISEVPISVTSTGITARRCIFRNNHADGSGGAISIGKAGIVTDCVFEGNTAIDGGAISVDGKALTIVNARFVNNEADVWGGAVLVLDPGGSLNAANCLFIVNHAVLGGGVSIVGSATANVGTSTFLANHATENGAAASVSDASILNLDNAIAWGSSGAPSLYQESGSALTVDHAIIDTGWGGAGTSIATVDPLFVDELGPDGLPGTGDENARLLESSPAIDAGDNALLPADVADLDEDADTGEDLSEDLVGTVRVREGDGGGTAEVDLGAFERTCAGDADGNGMVNFDDLTVVLQAWATAVITGTGGYLNDDGVVNFDDLTIVLQDWASDC